MDILLRLTAEFVPLTALRVELILCVVENSGMSLRSDDPQGLRDVISRVQKAATVEGAVTNSRVQFMLDALSDLKNNKSRRTQTAQAEMVSQMRKWLGRVKTGANKVPSGGAAESRSCLSVSLEDLLQAEATGRWWRAGARWGGRVGPGQAGAESADPRPRSDQDTAGDRGASQEANEEERLLLKLAKKLHMNTAARRNVFVVLMSSRDVTDAFERLSRLDLKGKQDREIMRVLCTCCGHERTYNPFYAELAVVFCNQNRQNRTTLQFVYWDHFNVLISDDEGVGEGRKTQLDRRSINLARMLAHLVAHFVMSLSVLKTVDMHNLNASLLLFLATFFMGLFSIPVSGNVLSQAIEVVSVRCNHLIPLSLHSCFRWTMPHLTVCLTEWPQRRTA